MTTVTPYPQYIPVRHKFAGALDASFTLDFNADTTWIMPLNGGFQGIKVEAQSLQIDNSSNSGKLNWTAGGGNGIILPYSSGSMDVQNYDEITFTCSNPVAVRMDLVNYYITPGFNNLVFQPNIVTSDPFFSSVIGLYHFDGINGSTVTPDTATAGFGNVSFTANASIDTAHSKFGTSSALFIQKTATAADAISSGTATFKSNWTIEFWLQVYSRGVQNHFNGLFNPNTAQGNAPNVGLQGAAVGTSWGIVVDKTYGGVTVATPLTQITVDGLFHHIAVVGVGTNVTVFVDGVAVVNSAIAWGAFAADNLSIARDTLVSTSASFSMEELRITNFARYLTNFTVPNAPFFDM